MLWSKLIALALVPATLATPLYVREAEPAALAPRDATAVADGVKNIGFKLKALNDTVNAYNGELDKALAINSASGEVAKALKQTIDATNASPKFDDNGSLAVGTGFLGLQPQIYTVLDNIVKKKPIFDKLLGFLSLRQTVLKTLQDEKALAKQLGDVVTAKLTPTFAGVAPGINNAIQARFDQAIAVYQKKTGGIELPPIPSF